MSTLSIGPGEERIAYLTDVEGRFDKLASFVEGSGDVLWSDRGELLLRDGVTFVFGGDAVDRGPGARRILRTLLEAHRRYGDRVVLLAGNRDINKLRLARELRGEPPQRAPDEVRGSPPALLRWIFAHTMGAKDAFVHRATELAAEGLPADDESVVESFVEDVAEGGLARRYLEVARLAFRSGVTLFLHGGATEENFGVVPGQHGRSPDVDAWVKALDALYASELEAFVRGRSPDTLLRYQAPRVGTRANQESVVYARLTDELANPVLPGVEVERRLLESGVHRLVVGHTPSGDTPAIVRDGDFELVLADNSYGRVERGSRVTLTDALVAVEGTSQLDDGSEVTVRHTSARGELGSPLGLRDVETGRLVKARLADGELLLFRGLPGYRVEQTRCGGSALSLRTLGPARP